MKFNYKTKGTCSVEIDVDLEDGIVKTVQFYGGCEGNLQGVSRLVSGMKATDVVKLLRGIDCENKGTSCPDQLAMAIEGALTE